MKEVCAICGYRDAGATAARPGKDPRICDTCWDSNVCLSDEPTWILSMIGKFGIKYWHKGFPAISLLTPMVAIGKVYIDFTLRPLDDAEKEMGLVVYTDAPYITVVIVDKPGMTMDRATSLAVQFQEKLQTWVRV